jgi:hypothetical protein
MTLTSSCLLCPTCPEPFSLNRKGRLPPVAQAQKAFAHCRDRLRRHFHFQLPGFLLPTSGVSLPTSGIPLLTSGGHARPPGRNPSALGLKPSVLNLRPTLSNKMLNFKGLGRLFYGSQPRFALPICGAKKSPMKLNRLDASSLPPRWGSFRVRVLFPLCKHGVCVFCACMSISSTV